MRNVKAKSLIDIMRRLLPIAGFLGCLAALPGLAMNRLSPEESKDPRAAADAAHLRVALVVPESNLVIGNARNDAGLYFKLEPGWHVYWKNAGDSGEPPHMKWTLPAGLSATALAFPAPKRLPLGPLMDFGYEGEVLFPFSFDVAKTAKPGTADLHAKVDWLVCREVCIPGKAELELTRNVVAGTTEVSGREGISSADAELFSRYTALVPKPLPAQFKAVFQPVADGFHLQVTTGRRETAGAFFPSDQNIVDNPAPQKLSPTRDGLILSLKKDANLTANPGQLAGVLELTDGRSFELSAAPGAVASVAGNAIESIPPSATTSSSTTAGAQPAPGAATQTPAASGSLLQSALFAFLGGLLLNLMPCVFPVLFIKGLALVRSGSEERHQLRNHGFVYAAGILVSFWLLVGALLALRAAGSHLGWGYQFQSPIFLSLMAALLFFLGLSLAGQFEIGLSLTSTGGTLAAKQGYAGSFFTGVLAVIVATPCTAPFMGAAIGYALSQSPVVTFAIFTALALGLAAPYVALTLQPAWTRFLPRPGAWMEVLKQATSVAIFGTVIWLAWVLAQAYGAALLAALLVSFLILAIAGWFLGRWPARSWSTAVAGALIALVVGLAILGPNKLAVVSARATTTGAHEAWEPWSADAVSRYQAQGRPVFVDFTASWCLSCQVNERVALGQPEVQKAFGDANVALLKADWTQHDETIGDTLANLGRSGVPAYVLYVPGESNPRLLPEVLTPGIVTDALAKLPRTATQAASSASNSK
jgi:thiol:disulfide interchange protein/DsbC/DsbD-like thiol-disulfide interchange protein